MFKLGVSILALALACCGQAFANDGGIAVIDVLGVMPGPARDQAEVKIYGGDVKALFDSLPSTSVGDYGKSLAIASRNNVVQILCTQEYDRPTTGQSRSDYECRFSVVRRSRSGIDTGQIDIIRPTLSSFTRYRAHNEARVLGIDPGGMPMGEMFSFYGNEAWLWTRALPNRLTFVSGLYQVQIACQREYERPTTGEWRDDYMCTGFLARN
ncbi:MAG: hypothetical protein AB7G93_12640 [Bdellovibrionales bacterium]